MPKKTTCQKLSDEAIELIAARFRVLGEASRLKLISALEDGAKNVSQLVKVTQLSQPNASRHLRTLTDAGVVVRHREKTEVYYAVAVPGIFELLMKVSRDLEQLAKIKPWHSL
jgi:DNA-binding transcriptional ArsR family regulator